MGAKLWLYPLPKTLGFSTYLNRNVKKETFALYEDYSKQCALEKVALEEFLLLYFC